LPQPSRR
ncbi:pentapeptide repeats family protein, partial [Vibrio parahaemolyticus EKP-028]